jgi:hypothetical protein
MRAPTALLRGCAGLLGPLLSVLLLGVLVVGSVHHHSDSASDHACAICSASHVPAVVTAAALPTTAPARSPERVEPVCPDRPASTLAATVAARGPPTI